MPWRDAHPATSQTGINGRKVYLTWRESFGPKIRSIIEAQCGAGARPPYTTEQQRAVRTACRDAWRAALQPFRYWPYKVWCDEIRRQLGLRPQRKSEMPTGRKRRCTMCWRWSTAGHRWEHDARCMACEGTGYRPAFEDDDRQQELFA